MAFGTAIALKMGVWSETDTGVPAATALDRTLRLVCASKVGEDVLRAAPNRKRVLTAVARFHASLPAGTYGAYSSWPQAADRATNATYVVVGAGGQVLGREQVDQRSAGDGWRLIGTYAFPDGNHYVEINNARTNGCVIADGIRFVKQ